MLSRTWILIVLFLAAGAPVPQGKKDGGSTRPKAGIEHEVLNELVGTWNVTWELPNLPGNLKYEGTQQSDLDVNGRWLIEKCDLPDLTGEPYSMRSMTGYDPDSKKYVSTWVDSMRSGLITFKGEWSRGDKTMTWHEVTESKKGAGQTLRLRIVDKNAHTLTIFPSSSTKEEDAIFRIEYRRKS